MRTSKDGIALIKRWEGLFLKAYYCQAGVLTIGYGHTNKAAQAPRVTINMKITAKEADDILASDLTLHEGRIARLVGPVSQPVFDVLASFDFNTGGLTLGNGQLSGVAKAAKRGDMQALTRELGKWIYFTSEGKKLVSKGLLNRRNDEAAYLLASLPDDNEAHVAEDGETASMPQAVEPPTPKSMIVSPTGNAAALVGTGGSVQVATDVASSAQAAHQGGDFSMLVFALDLMSKPTFWIAVATILGAAYLWFGHKHRLMWGHA